MRKRLLFVQLPLLDNDPSGATENHLLAARYLRHAVERSGEDRYYEPVIAGPVMDRLDNRHTIASILELAPGLIAATLYVWNVERTLRVLREIRRRRPGIVILVGGPEVDRAHPFLFRSTAADVAVTGEGEPVFPAILRALRRGQTTDFIHVAWRTGRAWRWGAAPAPGMDLGQLLPPPDDRTNRPDARGLAVMETTRGCSAKCAFCGYRRQRRTLSWLPVEDVLRRVRVLRRRGAREIRFIDPTFNSHPHFVELLQALARLNADGRLLFFAELRADTLTADVADRLVRANVRQLEVGVQSSDPSVLRAVGRSANVARVFAGIGLLAERGLDTTLDVMCGLPQQTPADVRKTVTRLARVRGGHVQLLHTLLIPGSELRRRRAHHGLIAQARPPYRVVATPHMTGADMVRADAFGARQLGRRPDSPAGRFVGTRLPDLFPERVVAALAGVASRGRVAGEQNRRAVVFRGDDLFGAREAIYETVRTALREEPDMPWQFVLNPRWEEPLDLVDRMIEIIDDYPDHFLDRIHVRRPGTQRVARRVFILLRRGRRYDRAWIAAAEALLAQAFY